jgi:two-component sensor histidine kinase
MTLVEAITNLTQIVTQMAQAQQATGMTAEQAALLQQVSADVAALKSTQQTVLGTLTTHTEQLSGLAQQLQANSAADQANAAADQALRDAIGDTSQLG